MTVFYQQWSSHSVITLCFCRYSKNETFWIKKLKKNAEGRLKRLDSTVWFKEGQT